MSFQPVPPFVHDLDCLTLREKQYFRHTSHLPIYTYPTDEYRYTISCLTTHVIDPIIETLC